MLDLNSYFPYSHAGEGMLAGSSFGISKKEKLFLDLIVGLSKAVVSGGNFSALQKNEDEIIATAKSLSEKTFEK